MSALDPRLPGAGLTFRILRDDGVTFAGLTTPVETFVLNTVQTRLAAASGLSAGEQTRASRLAAPMTHSPREPMRAGSGWGVYAFPGTVQVYVARDDGTHLSWGITQPLYTPQLAQAALLATAGLSAAEQARIGAIA